MLVFILGLLKMQKLNEKKYEEKNLPFKPLNTLSLMIMCLFDWILNVFAIFKSLLTFPLNAMMIVKKDLSVCLSVSRLTSVLSTLPLSSLICAAFSAMCPYSSGYSDIFFRRFIKNRGGEEGDNNRSFFLYFPLFSLSIRRTITIKNKKAKEGPKLRVY